MTKLKDLSPEQRLELEEQLKDMFLENREKIDTILQGLVNIVHAAHPSALIAQEHLAKVTQTLVPPALSAQEHFAKVAQALVPPALIAQEHLSKIALAFLPEMNAYAEHAKKLAESVVLWQKKSEQLAKQLEKENIFLIPYFSISDINSILDEIDKNKTMLEIYDEYFSTEENLMHLYESWMDNKFFKERAPILKQCLIAHFNKQYELSIPVMYIQIEAICKNLIRMEGQTNYKELKNLLIEQYKATVENKDGLLKFLSDDFAVEFITGQVFEHFKAYNCLSIYPNRHEIIHGTDNTYYLKPHASLRCILLMDMLSGFEDKFNSKSSN